jgi:hypothetical protein
VRQISEFQVSIFYQKRLHVQQISFFIFHVKWKFVKKFTIQKNRNGNMENGNGNTEIQYDSNFLMKFLARVEHVDKASNIFPKHSKKLLWITEEAWSLHARKINFLIKNTDFFTFMHNSLRIAWPTRRNEQKIKNFDFLFFAFPMTILWATSLSYRSVNIHFETIS